MERSGKEEPPPTPSPGFSGIRDRDQRDFSYLGARHQEIIHCPPLQSNSSALLSAPLSLPTAAVPCPLSPLLPFALLLTAALHTNSPIFLAFPCSPTLAFCHNQMLLSLTQCSVHPAPGDGPCPTASCIPVKPALAAHALLLLSPN